MISILNSKGFYTYILFYLIIPLDFSQKNIKLIESLYEQYDYFNITFIKMDNRYEKAYTNRYLKNNAFYRLSLGELLPNLNKIIYLDSDTICLKDLSHLYNLNFMGKIFLAKILNYKPGNLNFEVNTGVLLLNLLGMRKLKIEKKVLTLLNNGFRDPVYHDQAIINLYFKKYVGFLPLEYNTITFGKNSIEKYMKNYNGLYDFDSLYFSNKFSLIKHYAGNPKYKTYNHEDWYYFARKSKYFSKRSHNFSNIFNYTFF
jgi:lipopolysaccharide biosynthesis glycosyltransferase